MPFLPRRPLAFSLRTLLVLVTVLCAWLARERSVAVPRRDAIEGRLGKGIAYQFPEPNVADPPTVSWLRRCFGDYAISTVSVSTENEQDVFERVGRLFPEAKVQWAMITHHETMIDIFPLPSRDHGVYLSPRGPVVLEPQ
jgi:hypothetical protein